MTQTARVYGDSLYELAVEENLSDVILEQSQAVRDIFRDNPDYRLLLAEPSLPLAERIGLLDQAFSGSIEVYLLNFLKILCENGTLSEYAGCAEEYESRYNKDHGITVATAVSAVALTQTQADALVKKLEARTGKTVRLIQVVKPELIGGLRVEIDGRVIDGSVSSRIASVRRQLSSDVSAKN